MEIKNYIFISYENGYERHTVLNIVACDQIEALTKAYSYFGASYKLSCADFTILMNHKTEEEQIKMFNNFSNEKLVYFAPAADEGELINNLEVVDIIECR